MSKPPAFQFYPTDRAPDLDPLTMEERGMYLTLMRYLWPYGGPMPIDEVEALLGKAWVSLGSIFRRKFVENEGAICLQWMEDEREKQTAFRERQALNGSKGGRPRKAKNPSLSQAKPEPIPKKSPRVGDGNGNGVGISPSSRNEEGVQREGSQRRIPFGYKFDFMDLDWPEWAGNQVRETWARFIEYRWTHPKGKFRFSSKRSAQIWLNRQAQQFDTGRRFVAALEVTMSKGWLEPVSPSDFKYPLLAELDSQTPPEKPEHNPFA